MQEAKLLASFGDMLREYPLSCSKLHTERQDRPHLHLRCFVD